MNLFILREKSKCFAFNSRKKPLPYLKNRLIIPFFKVFGSGRTEGKLAIARNLKKMGLPVFQIAEGTGLSPEAIQKL
jgi:hypothetical protein